MLRIEGLRAGYGKSMVLEGLDLHVAEGEVLGLLGRNGTGKTTTLRAIMGEIPIRAGATEFAGADLAKLKMHERVGCGIAYVPQGRHIFAALSVRDNLRVSANGAGINAWRPAVEEMFDEFPVLRDKASQAGGQLSGGQQQLLALARALISSPRLVLLDEPSEGLQPSIITSIGQVITKARESRGVTFVLVEQNLDFVTSVATRIAIMEKGTIVLSESPEVVQRRPDIQHAYLGL